MSVEYRIRYSASSNASFHNERAEWVPWDDEDATPEEVEDLLHHPPAVLPMGLEEALEASGFEWSVEVREMSS